MNGFIPLTDGRAVQAAAANSATAGTDAAKAKEIFAEL